jgi:hypothetical protein
LRGRRRVRRGWGDCFYALRLNRVGREPSLREQKALVRARPPAGARW